MLNIEKFTAAFIMLFDSKEKKYTKSMITTWYELLKKFPEDKVLGAMKAIMYSTDEFLSVGKVIAQFMESEAVEIERQWAECLDSAIHNGEQRISARAGKALNSLGGIEWLKNYNPQKIEWAKKEFIAAFKNTPEPVDADFRCFGLSKPMYLPEDKQQLLTGDITLI